MEETERPSNDAYSTSFIQMLKGKGGMSMCRRYSISAGLEEVNSYFGISRVMYYYKSRYNISPMQSVPVVVQEGGERALDEYRWGLVPYWERTR